ALTTTTAEEYIYVSDIGVEGRVTVFPCERYAPIRGGSCRNIRKRAVPLYSRRGEREGIGEVQPDTGSRGLTVTSKARPFQTARSSRVFESVGWNGTTHACIGCDTTITTHRL